MSQSHGRSSDIVTSASEVMLSMGTGRTQARSSPAWTPEGFDPTRVTKLTADSDSAHPGFLPHCLAFASVTHVARFPRTWRVRQPCHRLTWEGYGLLPGTESSRGPSACPALARLSPWILEPSCHPPPSGLCCARGHMASLRAHVLGLNFSHSWRIQPAVDGRSSS